MRVLFLTKNSYLPQLIGGAEWSVHHFVKGLNRMGHQVAVLSRLYNGGWIGLQNKIRRRLTGRACPVDSIMGYRTYRGWDLSRGLCETVSTFRPDLVVVAGIGVKPVPIAQEALAMGLPMLYMVMDVEFENHGGPLTSLIGAQFTGNSRFTAQRLRDTFGITPTVVYPAVDVSQCRVSGTGSKVVFINPREKKGVLIMLALAEARPDIPFVFYETWSAGSPAIKERAKRAGNIAWRTSVLDPRKVYEEARIVMAPSQWEEAWGKIATEAQLSGIPVIGSDIGGLTESIGDGGIRLPAKAPAAEWLAALELLWDDPIQWEAHSRAALARAQRPEIQLERQIEILDGLVRTICESAAGHETTRSPYMMMAG
ncbi:MAG: glycosyltransferase [Herminiimonas sp.]|nr:glycosyltransferase [Herminiimonas sp.]